MERSRKLVETMETIGARYGATAAQVALNWVISFNGESIITIPGASKVKHAAESAGAMQFKLSAEELSQLDVLSKTF